jgi:type VI secretion system secreted protein VgrG
MDFAARFESDDLAGQPVEVRGFTVREKLGRPYVAFVGLFADDRDADFAALLGGDARLVFRRGDHQRTFGGVVRSVAAREASGGGVRVDVELVPAFALFELRRSTRAFQGKTLAQILEVVLAPLAEYGRQAELDLEGDHAPREYCLQYQESDLDFVHRLIEEEGVTYAFDQEGQVETLVFRDRSAGYGDAEVLGEPLLPVVADDRTLTDQESLYRIESSPALDVTSVAVAEVDWTLGGLLIAEEASGEGLDARRRLAYEHGRGRSVQVHSYAGDAYGGHDAVSQASRRREAGAAKEQEGEGEGRVIGFAAGRAFDLGEHPAALPPGPYLLTEVVHRHRAPWDTSGRSEGYGNTFRFVPKDVPYRLPRTTPKPFIPGIQTAVVTGPAGEEIHVDEHGRIKVKPHWDREASDDDTSSLFVRVQQPWAGSHWGHWWVPRMGMEVVLQFIDGDPDRPLVTGAVYNGTNHHPYPLPDEKTKSTIKSMSSPGGGGFNEWRFEDRVGQEQIFTHAQRNYDEEILVNHTTDVGADQLNHVAGNQTQKIGADQDETVGDRQHMTVDGNRTVAVAGDFKEDIGAHETHHVGGTFVESIGATETRLVGGDLSEGVGGSETRTVGGGQEVTIGGPFTQNTGGNLTETVTGSLTYTGSGGMVQLGGGGITYAGTSALVVEASGPITLLAGASATIDAPPTANLLASAMTLNAPNEAKWGGILAEACAVKMEVAAVQLGITLVKVELGLLEKTKSGDLTSKGMLVDLNIRINSGGVKANTHVDTKAG